MTWARVSPRPLPHGSFFQRNCSVTTGSAKVVDHGNSLSIGRARPLGYLEGYVEIAFVHVLGKARVDAVLNANMRRDGTFLEHQQHLYQCSHASRGLSMADICLNSANVQRLLR